MIATFEKKKHVLYDECYKILTELYQNIDNSFTAYFIALPAPRIWRDDLEKCESVYRTNLEEEGVPIDEIEKRIVEQNHVLSDGEFKLQTATKKLRTLLAPGWFENFLAKKIIQTIYDDWESTYRVQIEKILNICPKGDIWGDLRWIRQSITHRSSIGVDELKNTKFIKDFSPGQEIVFTSTIMEKIRQELENWYTEFLMKYFSPNTK